MKGNVAFASLIAASILAGCSKHDPVAEVQKGVLHQLGVPSSAKWGAIWTPDGHLVCGFVTAMTVDGVYGDKHLFWGSTDRDVKMDGSGMDPIDHVHRQACGQPAKKLYTMADGGPVDVLPEPAAVPYVDQHRAEMETALRLQDEVRASLKDPRSAIMDQVWLASDGVTYCGYVNARNSFGAYTGRALFVGGRAQLARTDPSDEEIAACQRGGARPIIRYSDR